VVIGSALVLDFVNRGAGAARLQILLQSRFVVAQGGSGEQLLSQVLDGIADDVTLGESSDGFEAAIEKEGANHGFHAVGKHRALAAQSAAIFAATETQMLSEADFQSHVGHVLAAHELRTHARQFAFGPLRMQEEESLADDESQDSVAEKFEALVVAFGFRIFSGVLESALVGERTVGKSAHEQLGSRKMVLQGCLQFRES